MSEIDFNALQKAMQEADEKDLPITDQTARWAAKTIHLALWRGHLDTPPILTRFIEDGSYDFDEFYRALDEVAEAYSSGQKFTTALQRYADFHQKANGTRGAVPGWPTD